MSSSRSKWVKILSAKNSRTSLTGYGQAEAGQVVQLPEGPREGRLAAVVRAAYYQDSLRVGEVGARF